MIATVQDLIVNLFAYKSEIRVALARDSKRFGGIEMRLSILALFFFVSIGAHAVTSTQLNIGLGTSVPVDSTMLVQKSGPSRSSGGEHIYIKFASAKNILEIKLTGYSAGKAGKTLIHSATGINGTTKVSLDGLSQFAKVTSGNPENYKNLVMLPDTTFVLVSPGQAFTQIDIVAEGYTNNDSSLVLQITSSDGLPLSEFIVTRSSTSETLGGLIDESKFAKFGLSELRSVMSTAVPPALEDLVGKVFVCSSYSRLDATKVNYKTRAYLSPAPGVLQSRSELQGPIQTWTMGAYGVELPVENFNGCGNYITTNTLRVTGAGNLISEVLLDLESFLTLCEKAGFDKESVRAVESNSTYPSVLDPKFVVDSYEFCHPAN